jgi:antibiotic biosynthesis monooxygenase (ABM) superfamily enzyme
MVVLLMLFPVVFLFGHFVQVPILQLRLGLPFAVALLIGNIVGVVLLNWLVPWASNRFGWWLSPPSAASSRTTAGAAVIAAILIVLAIIFWQMG